MSEHRLRDYLFTAAAGLQEAAAALESAGAQVDADKARLLGENTAWMARVAKALGVDGAPIHTARCPGCGERFVTLNRRKCCCSERCNQTDRQRRFRARQVSQGVKT